MRKNEGDVKRLTRIYFLDKEQAERLHDRSTSTEGGGTMRIKCRPSKNGSNVPLGKGDQISVAFTGRGLYVRFQEEPDKPLHICSDLSSGAKVDGGIKGSLYIALATEDDPDRKKALIAFAELVSLLSGRRVIISETKGTEQLTKATIQFDE